MPDRHPREPNGRTDLARHDDGATLAAAWDRRVLARRGVRSAAEPTDTVPDAGPTVARLEALSRAAGASAPRPEFLNDLEAELMRTQTTPITIPTEPRPAPRTRPAVPNGLRVPRRGRGVIDILSVAAVVALLLGGSWFAFDERGSAPTPDGGNGVAGLTSPDATPTAIYDDGIGTVALDQPWAENLPVDEFGLGQPVGTRECTTPSREPGTVLAAVEAAYSIGGVATPTVEPLLADPGAIDLAAYPAAGSDDVASVDALFHQVAACRFAASGFDGQAIEPYTGPVWSLYTTDALAIYPLSLGRSSPEHVVEQAYQIVGRDPGGWAYAARTIDVREFPADGDGNPRLLVRSVGIGPVAEEALSLLVFEDGLWRFAVVRLDPAGQPLTVRAQVANVRVGVGTLGPIATGFGSQLEAGSPVAFSIVNTGATAQRVTFGGQDLGVVDPGSSIEIQPFLIRPEAVAAAGGRLPVTMSAVPTDGSVNGADRTLTVGLYPAGYVVDPRVTVSTPTPVPAEDQCPDPTATATDVAVALAPDDSDRTVTLEQPWAEPVGDVYVDGSYPVDVARCRTPPRASGSIVDLVAANAERPVADLPSTIDTGELSDLLADHPDAGEEGYAAAAGFFEQMAACRFAVSPTTGPVEALYTAPAWSLYSDAFLLRAFPTQGRTVDAIVRQGLRLDTSIVDGPYVNVIESVRTYPADAAGQARLLVTYHHIDLPRRPDVTLLVFEGGIWRLDAVASNRDVAEPDYDPVVRSVDIDLGRSSDVDGLIDIDLTDLPIVMTLFNGTSVAQEVTIGGQAIGRLLPGEAVRIQPFTVIVDRIPDSGLIDVPVGLVGADGSSQSLRLRISPPLIRAATPAG